MVKVQRLFAKTNLKIHVCRTDKNPLGTKGRTSILSYREYHASCGAVFSVSRRKLPDRECCVTSFRQGGYTPPLRRLCGYPLWTCRQQVWRLDINKSSAWSKPYGGLTVLRTPVYFCGLFFAKKVCVMSMF